MKSLGAFAWALLCSSALLLLASCNDNDKGSDYIMGKIFISQASVSSGIVNYEYEVPADINSDQIHHILDESTNTLKIILDVSHDGIDALPYDVSVSEDALFAESCLPNVEDGVILTDNYYTLPDKVSVSAGEKSAKFYLDVDLDKLTEDYSRNVDKKFILAVRISDPSQYDLNTDRNRAIVIIDGRTFIPESVETYIFMPQASLLDGGKTNNYPVPFDDKTKNYTYDKLDLSLTIPLGVARSENDPEASDEFSVTIGADQDHSASVLKSIPDGVLLPEAYYVMPSTATVEEGGIESTFNLRVDFAKLSKERPELADKKLVLTVALSNPTLYTLNEQLNKTVVIIDAAEFYEIFTGNLLRGGEFGAEDAVLWTFVNIDNTASDHPIMTDQVAIRDGVLRFTINKRCSHLVYQTVQITEAGTYKISLDFLNKGIGAASTGRVYMMFGDKEPVSGKNYYTDNSAARPSARIEGNSISAVTNGLIPFSNTTWFKPGWDVNNLDKVTVTTPGTYYFVMGVFMWSSKLDSHFDNAKFEKVD